MIDHNMYGGTTQGRPAYGTRGAGSQSGTYGYGYSSPPSLSSVTSNPPDGPTIPARLFQNVNNLRPNEVPPDGTPAVFMASDLSYIIAKQVNRSGVIDELRYIPEVKEEQTATPVPAMQEEMYAMLQNLMKKTEEIEKKLNRPYQKNNYHKYNGNQAQNGTSQTKATVEGGNNA